MNTWLQPLLTQVFKVVPQEAWMAVPRILHQTSTGTDSVTGQDFRSKVGTPKVHTEAIILTGRRSWTWLTRPMSSAESLAATALRNIFLKSN